MTEVNSGEALNRERAITATDRSLHSYPKPYRFDIDVELS